MIRLFQWFPKLNKNTQPGEKQRASHLEFSISSIIPVYVLLNIISAIVLYPIIPCILEIPVEIINLNKTILSMNYSQMYLFFMISFLFLGFIILTFALKGLKGWESIISGKNVEDSEKIRYIRNKCMHIPYFVYFMQIILPCLGFLMCFLISGKINVETLIFLSKLEVLIITFSTFTGVILFVFSKKVLTEILFLTIRESNIDSLRLGVKSKIFLQILPVFTAAILFTSLLGHSRVIHEKGDVLFKINASQLTKISTNIETVKNEQEIKEALSDLVNANPGEVKKSYFYITPEGEFKFLDAQGPGSRFINNSKELTNLYKGRIYGYSGEIQGTAIKVNGTGGYWTVGVKYKVLSEQSTMFFIISFLVLLIINVLVIYYFSKSLANDLRLVVKGLNEIIEGDRNNKRAKLPVTSNDEVADLVLAFNRIQDIEKDKLELFEKQQDHLIENERLASLGQLIGGITHNLRSPIMSISGAYEALKDLINEYEESIDDTDVTRSDHHEIAKEMISWVEKIKPQCSYMSELISAVKGQAVGRNVLSSNSFSIGELIKRVDILMNHELKTNHCKIQKDIEIDLNTEIKGEINNLVQVLNNLIINAIHSYDGEEGMINLSIMKKDKNVEFIIRDNGRGIPKEVQEKLFKEMITTKGKNGTGLGLYMSYSTIRRFRGDMRFQSEEGKGTAFYITIPSADSNFNKGGEVI